MVKAIIVGLNEWDKFTLPMLNSAKKNDPELKLYLVNMALARGRWGLWEIGCYFDCANLERYLDLLGYLKGRHE